jgi:hypothetical protein
MLSLYYFFRWGEKGVLGEEQGRGQGQGRMGGVLRSCLDGSESFARRLFSVGRQFFSCGIGRT